MKRAVFFFLLFLIPYAFSQSVPTLPALYWGEVNAACALTTLAPGIVIQAKLDGNVLDSLSIADEGNNIYRFGGPSASDGKLILQGLSEGQEFNLVLYVNPNASFVVGQEDFNAGEVKYLYFELSDSNCSTLFPPANYDVNVSLPPDCNGSLNGLSIEVYYGSTRLISSALSGDKIASKSFTIDGRANSVPEGASIIFKLCNGSDCASTTRSYNYGESDSFSWSISCSTLFPSSITAEEPPTAPITETNTTTTTETSTTTSTETSTTQTTTTSTEDSTVSGARDVPVPEDKKDGSVVSGVVDALGDTTKKILGMPPDVAMIVALVVIIIIIVVIRFVL